MRKREGPMALDDQRICRACGRYVPLTLHHIRSARGLCEARRVTADLERLARLCRHIVEAAQRDLGEGLLGKSKLDLVADRLPDMDLSSLRSALVVAGYGHA